MQVGDHFLCSSCVDVGCLSGTALRGIWGFNFRACIGDLEVEIESLESSSA